MIKHRGIKIMLIILMVLIVSALFTPPLSAVADDLSSALYGYSSFEFLPSNQYMQSDIKATFKIFSDNAGLPATEIQWITPQSTTTLCNPHGGVCETTYEYAPNGVITSKTTEFLISGQQRPSGSYTAIVTYCSYRVSGICMTRVEMFRAYFYINADTYAISGNAGIGDATLSYHDGTNKTVAADGSGNYTIAVPPGWSGTVTPSMTNYAFLPASRTYTNVQADKNAQNYTAVITHQISLPLVIH